MERHLSFSNKIFIFRCYPRLVFIVVKKNQVQLLLHFATYSVLIHMMLYDIYMFAQLTRLSHSPNACFALAFPRLIDILAYWLRI